MEEKTREELIELIQKLKSKNSSLSDAVTQMKVREPIFDDFFEIKNLKRNF